MSEDSADNVTPNSTGSASSPEPETAESREGQPETREPRPRVFGRFAFWIVVFPFVVYLIGMQTASYLESMRVSYLLGELDDPHHGEDVNRPPQEEVDISTIEVDPDATFLLGLLPLGKNSYPYTYTTVILITAAMMLLVCWGYFKVPLKISPLSVGVGIVGFVLWIGLSYLDRQFLHLGEMLSSGRSAFNPFEELKDSPSWLRQFLAIRFFGLVIVVPIIEEFFVRGFLIRYVDDPDWDEQPLGVAKTFGWLSPTIYGVVAHMTEPLSALVWFSLVTLLYKKTGSIWDCVVAHAVTNLLLWLYVVKFEAWHLW
jgi:CAAX prenyl protease-like protein